MSSCRNASKTREVPHRISVAKMRKEREVQIYSSIQNFLRPIVSNTLVLEGISGNFDMAFKVNRKKIVAQYLRDLADELEGKANDRRK